MARLHAGDLEALDRMLEATTSIQTRMRRVDSPAAREAVDKLGQAHTNLSEARSAVERVKKST